MPAIKDAFFIYSLLIYRKNRYSSILHRNHINVIYTR